jgi:hypothetical protein
MSDPTVANTILRQMGGLRKICLMTGARDFVYDDNSVQFRFPNRGKRINKCRVIYNYGTDLYIFELWYVSKKGAKLVFSLEDVYFDMLIPLFEKNTGLYLSL